MLEIKHRHVRDSLEVHALRGAILGASARKIANSPEWQAYFDGVQLRAGCWSFTKARQFHHDHTYYLHCTVFTPAL
jgi:hypothetical protein